jgi:hypothetical protein
MAAELIQQWRWSILQSDLPPGVRHVALTLAVYMNRDGQFHKYRPGVRALEEATGRRNETITAAIHTLLDAGYLILEPGWRNGMVKRYQAALPVNDRPSRESGTVDR